MSQEKWEPIPETKYEVSSLGKIRHIKHKRIRKMQFVRGGRNHTGALRCRVKLHGVKYEASRLVAQAFIPNPENKPQVNHKDGIPIHNRASNLEWATNQENMDHAVANDLTGFGRRNANAKLTDEDVEFLRADYVKGDQPYLYEYAEVFGVDKSVICKAIRGDTWARAGAAESEAVRHRRVSRKNF